MHRVQDLWPCNIFYMYRFRLYIYICIYRAGALTKTARSRTPKLWVTQQERFASKAELVVESRKEQTVTVKAGYYSEKAMKDELKWAPCL